MTTRHTPGPWHDDGYRIYGPTDEPDPRSGRVIVEYKHAENFSHADAALIAAAPDLFEVCQAVVMAGRFFPATRAALGTIYDDAAKAVAKAEGATKPASGAG
jgi:hypothetical protein